MNLSEPTVKASLRIVGWSFVYLLAVLSGGVVAIFLGHLIVALSWTLVGLWAGFALFVFYLYRNPKTPSPYGMPGAIVAPSHGRVDFVDQVREPVLMGGECRRVSIVLSWWEVQVQKAPVDGVVTYYQQHREGQSAPEKTGEATLIGFLSRENAQDTVLLRIQPQTFPRRVLSWIRVADRVERGSTLAMTQFGGRCELYVPMRAEVQVRAGDTLCGGSTIVATWS